MKPNLGVLLRRPSRVSGLAIAGCALALLSALPGEWGRSYGQTIPIPRTSTPVSGAILPGGGGGTNPPPVGTAIPASTSVAGATAVAASTPVIGGAPVPVTINPAAVAGSSASTSRPAPVTWPGVTLTEPSSLPSTFAPRAEARLLQDILAIPVADAPAPEGLASVGLWPAWGDDLALLPNPAAGPRWASLIGPGLALPESDSVPDWWQGGCARDLSGVWVLSGQQAGAAGVDYTTRVSVAQAGIWLVVWQEDNNHVYYGGCRGSTLELDAYSWDGDSDYQFAGYEFGRAEDFEQGAGSTPVVRVSWMDTLGAGSGVWTRP